jgi:hypothetical protein
MHLTTRTSRKVALAVALALGLALPARAHADEKLACIGASEDGQNQRDQGKLLAARASFARCVSDTCPAVVRTDCGKWLADVEERIPTLQVRVRDGKGQDVLDATLLVDGAARADATSGRFVPIDPGVHVLRCEHAGGEPVEQRIVVREREKDRLLDLVLGPAGARATPPADHATAPDAPPGRPFPVGAAIAGGVAVLALGSFAFFGATAKSDLDHLRATCEPACATSDADAAHTKWIVANASLGVAAIAAGLAVWLYLSNAGSAPPPPRAALLTF